VAGQCDGYFEAEPCLSGRLGGALELGERVGGKGVVAAPKLAGDVLDVGPIGDVGDIVIGGEDPQLADRFEVSRVNVLAQFGAQSRLAAAKFQVATSTAPPIKLTSVDAPGRTDLSMSTGLWSTVTGRFLTVVEPLMVKWVHSEADYVKLVWLQ